MAFHLSVGSDESAAQKWRSGVAVAAVAMLAFVVALSGPEVSAQSWTGKEETKDGVVHVMNPKTPIKKAETIKLEEQWRIGGYDDDEIFGVITAIITDGSNFYMLDSQLNEIKVYSTDGEYLRTIGREGEGPGEFRRAFNIFMLPDGNIGVLQAFPPKIVMLTPDGEPAGEYPLPDSEEEGFRIILSARNAGDQLALAWRVNQPSETIVTLKYMLSLIGDGGTKETRLHTHDALFKSAEPKIVERTMDTMHNRWTASKDGRVFSCITFGDYAITVWRPDGGIDRVIHRDYPVHVRSAEEKEWILGLYKRFTRQVPVPGMKYEVEDNWNQVQSLQTRDDGTLWVRTSRGTHDLPDGAIGGWDVFDRQGRFVRHATLKGQGDPTKDSYQFVGDRLFVVTDFLDAFAALQGGGGTGEEDEDEEEAEPMEIISYTLK